MKVYLRFFLVALCGLFVAPLYAGQNAMRIEYTGTVRDSVDPIIEGTFVISHAQAKGSFGPSDVQVISHFYPVTSSSNCTSTEYPVEMSYARSITTFKDDSQMFVFWDAGWMCITPGPAGQASYRGWAEGRIIGGSNRFEGAGGHVETSFSGYDLAGPWVSDGPPFPAFGSFVGSMWGNVEFAD